MSALWLQIERFWSFDDPAVRTAVAGVLLLAASCGSLGCFIVLRRLSLLGDSLGHAVLPGVCGGFMVAWSKDLRWIFAGAVISALLASWLIGVIVRYTRLKPDAAMGLVLSGFFGLGMALMARLSKVAGGSQAGLNVFLFGQVSAISERDLWLTGGLALVIVLGVLAFFKELAATSFDEGFSTTVGINVKVVHYLLMSLTALAIVISLQAVGVVLLSALLITPAATALLLTDRLGMMVVLSVTIAAVGGVLGLNLSFLKRELPTGPFIVLVLTLFFAGAYLFSPRYGLLVRSVRRWRRSTRTQRENLLKSVYLAIRPVGAEGAPPAEAPPRQGTEIPLARLAQNLAMAPHALQRRLRGLVRHGWVDVAGGVVRLTDSGIRRAGELDRNYRLWELFLTREVQIPADHVERDAEDIEHLLTPELVAELEEKYAAGTPRPQEAQPGSLPGVVNRTQ
jgi:manganese/zinc/iron transport system permease protein